MTKKPSGETLELLDCFLVCLIVMLSDDTKKEGEGMKMCWRGLGNNFHGENRAWDEFLKKS